MATRYEDEETVRDFSAANSRKALVYVPLEVLAMMLDLPPTWEISAVHVDRLGNISVDVTDNAFPLVLGGTEPWIVSRSYTNLGDGTALIEWIMQNGTEEVVHTETRSVRTVIK